MDGEPEVLAWFDNSDGTIYCYTTALETYMNTDGSYMFYQCDVMNNISGLSNWKTDKVANMSWMFFNSDASSFEVLSDWDTSNVTNMRGMFRDCAFLTSFKFLSSWNTGKVTDMSEIFRNCSKLPEDLLTSINDWDISSVDISAEPTTDAYSFYWICYNCQSHPNWPGTWTDDGTYIPGEEPMMLITIATPSTPSNALCPEIATSSTPNKSTATEPSFIASPSEADRATSSVATRIIRHNNDKDEEDDDMSTPSSARRKNASGQNNKKKITVSIKKEDIKVEEKMFSGLTKRKLNKKINVSVEKITNRKVSEKIATSSIVRRKT